MKHRPSSLMLLLKTQNQSIQVCRSFSSDDVVNHESHNFSPATASSN
jgi:hypothetical protein